MKLTAKRVDEIFRSCLFKDGEDTTNHVVAKGIMHNVGFHPERLEENRTEVEGLLLELPEAFRKSAGGGWSFLNACMDKDGNQWGEHINMEQLFLLGMALNKVECPLPKQFWPSLPGGVPYYVVNV